jgi:tripartite-type tricarboxylate transporter receptor subunit TctC
MPGAGGITAANFIYSIVPRDGSVIGALGNTVPFEPIFRPKVAKFDADKFNWLGSPNAEVGLLIAWHTSQIKTFEDAKKHEMIVGATGAASTPAFYARILNDVFGTKLRVLAGYPGQNEAFIAMERGENEGFPSTFWSSLKAIRPDWIKEKKVRLLLQYGLEPHPELKDVPFALDLVHDPAKKQLLEAAVAPLSLGRPLVAPPEVPPERVAILRKAMLDTFRDPGFIADCEKQRLEVGNFVSGERMEKIVGRVYAMPAEIKDRLVQIYAVGREEQARQKKQAK